MRLNYDQLAALVAVIREGSFDAAARTLHVTPSAVSQRIRQLEEAIGGTVVVRGTPCVATATGTSIYRHALQVELLEKDLEIGHDIAQPIAIAVNADSLATWLVPAIARFTAETNVRVELLADDQDHTADWLRTGKVLGAITGEAHAVQGCRVEALGSMRYRATATPRFMRKWFANGVDKASLEQAPALAFNRKDTLQTRFVQRTLGRKAIALPLHFVPSPHAFVDATLAGLGWGMNPEALITSLLAKRRLVDLIAGAHLDVPLYWQQWSLASPVLATLTTCLAAAAATLRAA